MKYCIVLHENLFEATLICFKDTVKKAHSNSIRKKNDKL